MILHGRANVGHILFLFGSGILLSATNCLFIPTMAAVAPSFVSGRTLAFSSFSPPTEQWREDGHTRSWQEQWQLTVLTNQWLSSLLWEKNQNKSTIIDWLLGRCFTTKMTLLCVLAIHPPTFPVNALGGNFFTTSLSSTSTLLRCISLGSSTDWGWRPDLELWSTGGKTTNQHKMKHRINDLLTAWGGGIVLTFFVLGKFPVIVFVRVISSIGDGYSKGWGDMGWWI